MSDPQPPVVDLEPALARVPARIRPAATKLSGSWPGRTLRRIAARFGALELFDRSMTLAAELFTAIFPILISAMEGARSVPPRLLDVSHSYGSNERQLWADVVIPYTVPYAVTGIKQGITGALVGTIIAELFLNATGVGDLLIRASTNFDSAGALAVTLVISIIAVALMGVSGAVERHFAGWREGLSG